MRPPAPVPVTSVSLMPFSERILRTIGERSIGSAPPPSLDGATGDGATGDGAGAAGGGVAAAGGAAAGAGDGGCGAGSADAGGASAGADGASAAADGASANGASVAPDAPEPSPITASLTPTSTVSPSGTKISVRTPAAGDGTSESTLSVETSKRGSSRSIVSPTAFIQRVIVPSVTVSPSCGIITSGKVQSPSGQCQHRLAECLGQ